MDSPALQRLKDDIQANGLENPIWLYEGRILDGRNRHHACRELGCEMEFRTFEGTEEEATAFVDSQNLHRRHLTPDQQARLREERIERVAAARTEGKSLRTIAAEEGVSQTQVKRDLETAGVTPVTPETTAKVQGADGKKYSASKPREKKAKPAVPTDKGLSVESEVVIPPAAAPNPEEDDKPERSAPAKGTIKKPPTVDAWGVPVQPHAVAAFDAVPRFKELLWHINQARKLFSSIAKAEGGQFLQLPEVSAYRVSGEGDDGEPIGKFVSHDLESALSRIENAIPTHTACPWRFVDGPYKEPCNACLGLNWTPVLGINVPDVAVERIKEKFGV
jgi:ParB-like chromosome segregation protein Spo0J